MIMENRNIYNNSQGLTLVELLVAITLLGFVLTIATAMILPSYEIYDSSTRRMSASQLAELAKREVSSYLRMAVNDEDNEFSSNYDEDRDEWSFYGYHRTSEENEVVEYVLKHNNGELMIEINDLNYNRMIVNNVQKFNIVEITEDDSVSLEFYIKINDGDNIAEKRITVNPRNF